MLESKTTIDTFLNRNTSISVYMNPYAEKDILRNYVSTFQVFELLGHVLADRRSYSSQRQQGNHPEDRS